MAHRLREKSTSARGAVLAAAGLTLAVFVPPARADLPSLMPDKGDGRARVDTPHVNLLSGLDGLDAWRRGRIYFRYLGALDYRAGGGGLKAGFYTAGAYTSAFVGYDGARRIEMAWPAPGGSVKISYVDEDEASGLRVELALEF